IIAGIIAAVFAMGFLIYMNIVGLQERRTKRNVERKYSQLKVSRQIERARLEKEILKLQDEAKDLKKMAIAPPPASVVIPDQWKDSSTIFLGAFDDKQSAVEKAKGLRGVRHKAHVIGIGSEDGGKKYLLVLGNFKDNSEAVGVLDEFQIQGKLLDADVMPFTEVVKVRQ
ncbi:MAG: SPOR domain-containing protein, partial [Candidatus Brocadiales bacterium]